MGLTVVLVYLTLRMKNIVRTVNKLNKCDIIVCYALRRANAFKECASPYNIPLGILNKHYGILSLAWIDWYKSKSKRVKCK